MATSAASLLAGTGGVLAQDVDAPSAVILDEITVVPSRTEETATQSMAGVSIVGEETIELLQPSNAAELFFGVPGVSVQQDGSRTSSSINIRGLEDFGRVAVIVDGARNNFQRSKHGTQSVFWLEPEMLKSVTVVRGPVANTYGSGAIGGVVVFETKSAEDFLHPDETFASEFKTRYETNGNGFLGSAAAAARMSDSLEIIGNILYRTREDYEAGNGATVPGSAYDIVAGYGKVTVRPTEFSSLELGWISNETDWLESFGDVERDSVVRNDIFSGIYEYSNPANPWIDVHVGAYVNRTEQEQVRVTPSPFDPAGSKRSFELITTGFDIYNTSRFDTGPLFHAVTYGGDFFHDDVTVVDPSGFGSAFTPNGERRAYGAYVQDQISYSDWLEVIGALRYDGYELEGGGFGSSGERISPRLTVGIRPFERTAAHGLQIYGTYAEGYRAPSVTETLISGTHPAPAPFPLLPNPNLRPETAQTVELGLNYARDGIFTETDGIRIKAAVFQNNVEDFIDEVTITPPDPCAFTSPVFFCVQYQNIAKAEIRGVELEANYDAGRIFAGLSGHVIDGENVATGAALASIPAYQATGRLGFRFLEERLQVGGEVQRVVAPDDLPPGFPPPGLDRRIYDDYTLVNLFASYEANENLRFDMRLNNIFDEAHGNLLNSIAGASAFEEGFNAKFAATLRFGYPAAGIFGQ